MNDDITLKTLRTVVNEYLQTIEKPKRRRNAKSVLNQFCNFMPRGIRIGDLKPKGYDDFLKSKDLSDSSLQVYASRLNSFEKYIDSCRSEPKSLEQPAIKPPASASKKSPQRKSRRGRKSKIKELEELIREYYLDVEKKEKIITDKQETIDRLEKQHENDQKDKVFLKSEVEELTQQINTISDERDVLKEQIREKKASKEQLSRINAQILEKHEEEKELETKILSHQDSEQKLALIDQYPNWEERIQRIESVEIENRGLKEKLERVEADLIEANETVEKKDIRISALQKGLRECREYSDELKNENLALQFASRKHVTLDRNPYLETEGRKKTLLEEEKEKPSKRGFYG